MLRVEDTDRTRYVEWSIENMIHVLETMGLIPDEGPNKPWNHGPYKQSERLDIYNSYMKELLQKDKAYYCFCSSERLDELRKEQTDLWLATKYDWKCRYLSKEEVDENLKSWKSHTIRLKVPKNEQISFIDAIRWKIEINSKEVDDQVLMKSDWFPTYHFAVVVDDHLMEITHVIRGEEWVPSTPKHILTYEAFWWTPPTFAHLPLLLWTDKKKLSKRTGDVSVESYLEKGYVIDAIINYIALLGWNPKTTEEFFTMNELIERFDLETVHKAGAVFDMERLEWFSWKYIANMETSRLYTLIKEYLKKYDNEYFKVILNNDNYNDEYNKAIISELKSRLRKLSDFRTLTGFFYSEAKINTNLCLNPKMKIEDFDTVKKWLEIAKGILTAHANFQSIDEIKNIFVEKISEAWMKNGQVLWPVRVALSWEEFSPGALELIYILGNKKSSERIEKLLKEIA